ncbi:MAG: radical SAM protein [Syntrophobacterales bacterium]|nr:radical SAM protein [Syntrophobacterales bacterium]
MKPIRYIVLIVTTRCNLSCCYCYSGEVLSHRDMTDEVIERSLEIAARGEVPLHLQITGGEPTLVPHLVERILKRARNTIRRPYTIGLQTNGTNLSVDLVEKLRHFNVQVGISLDGPPTVHEKLRGKIALTLKGIKILEYFRIPFRVTTVVTSQNVGSMDRLLYMLSNFREIRGIGLDILVRKGRALSDNLIAPPLPEKLKEGIRSFVRTCKAINKMRSTPILLREQERLKEGLSKGRSKFFCHALQGESIAVMPDGEVFPCGQTAGDRRFFVGNVWNLDESKLDILKQFTPSEEGCKNCAIQNFCPGDCPSRTFYNEELSNLACIMYQAIWEAMEVTSS